MIIFGETVNLTNEFVDNARTHIFVLLLLSLSLKLILMMKPGYVLDGKWKIQEFIGDGKNLFLLNE